MTSRHQFKQIHLDPTTRWRIAPFDLKFDAKWTHQGGSSATMNDKEEVFVSVKDRDSAALSGMRFSTGESWILQAAGSWIRLNFETRSTTNIPVPFRAVYLPQDQPHSGFYSGFANPVASTLCFKFKVPAETKAKTHFIVLDPLNDNADVAIVNASLEIL